jgi:hypothetical protein
MSAATTSNLCEGRFSLSRLWLISPSVALAGDASAVQAVSTAALLCAFNKTSTQQPPLEDASAPLPASDSLINTFAALSIGGGAFQGGAHAAGGYGSAHLESPWGGDGSNSPPETAQDSITPGETHRGLVQSPYGSRVGFARDETPRTKVTPTLSSRVSLPPAYVPRSPSPIPPQGAGVLLDHGGQSANRPSLETGAGDLTSQTGGPDSQWKGPREEERLRFLGESEYDSRVVKWLNQHPPQASPWTEPEGNGPDPSESPAAGRPSPRGFGGFASVSRGLEGELRDLEDGSRGLEGEHRGLESRVSAGDVDPLQHSEKRGASSQQQLPPPASKGYVLSAQRSASSETLQGQAVRIRELRQDEGIYITNQAEDVSTQEVEIARVAVGQALPEEDEEIRKGSKSISFKRSHSSGRSANTLVSLGKDEAVAAGVNGPPVMREARSEQRLTGLGQQGSPIGLEQGKALLWDRKGSPQSSARAATGVDPRFDGAQTPGRKRSSCFPKFGKLVVPGRSKPEKVSANQGRKPTLAAYHEPLETQSGPAAFYSARDSSVDPISQSYSGFTEGGEEEEEPALITVESNPTMATEYGDEGKFRLCEEGVF